MHDWRCVRPLLLALAVCLWPTSRALTAEDPHAHSEHAGAEHDAHHGHGEGEHGHAAHTIHGRPPTPVFEGKAGTEFLFVDPRLFFWTLGVFTITALLLRQFAWKPILASIEEREQVIADSLAEATKVRQEAQRLLEEQSAELDRAHEQAKRMLEEARAQANGESEAVIHRAREEAAKVQEEAEQRIAAASQKAMADLKVSAADLAVEIAGKVVKKKIDRSDVLGLVEETLS